MNKTKYTPVVICRILLGALFIFSGFTKGVDPMGSAIKLGEYFYYFGFDFLKGSETFFSIALSVGEMVLGFMLIANLRMRLTAVVASVGMLLFTIFTLFIALTNPVADCGCFGDAIKMSNWASFFKNLLILFPLSIVVMFDTWASPVRKTSWKDFVWIGVFGCVACSISLYALKHLPLIDFLPYKTGVNIPEMIARGNVSDEQTKLIYRNIETGQTTEFDMGDTTWHDTTRWEYVNTIVPEKQAHPMDSPQNFALLDAGQDVTSELLDPRGVLFLLCVSNPAKLQLECARSLADAAREAMARGYRVVAVTPAVSLGKRQTMLIDQNLTINYYNIDDVTLKTLLRSRAGLVVLRDGTIVDKMACDDIPQTGRFPDYGQPGR